LSSALIVTAKLSKTFHSKKTPVQALRDISITVNTNEIACLMGPSGCGKSTLLKIIAGIETATEGQLLLFGQNCTASVPQKLKRRIGFIYQDSNLLPWRSVERNLRFPLEIFGIQKEKEYEDRIHEALEIVGLTKYRDALPQELSGGMMQRVGIARSLVYNPDLLLMDQPFGALDAITRKKLRFDFLKIFQHARKTIVIATNSVDEALLFATRIYVIRMAPGTVEEVVEVGIPFEERKEGIEDNETFIGLRRQMIEIVKRQYALDARAAHFSVSEAPCND
jgi:NitT/TauT family transport system ATP-binding protein